MVGLSLSRVPADVLLDVAALLANRSDLLRQCKSFYYELAPVLYQCVFLGSTEQCTATLNMLKRQRTIARHVRELIVRPSRPKGTREQLISDSRAASAAVAEIASNLDALKKFSWCGDECHEEMWLALRMCCPRLRYLYDFVDLLGFSVNLTPGFYERDIVSLLEDEEERRPSKRLWDMLFQRCPNLEELVIEGHSPFPVDVRCLTEGRWPHLHKLRLGDVAVDWTTPPTTGKGAFIAFLEAHDGLHSLGLSRHNVDHRHLTALEPDILKLSSFTGTFPQLQTLVSTYPHLMSLTFREPLWSRDVMTMTLSSVLQQLPALTQLNVTFLLHSPYDSSSILRALMSSCPNLRDLKLSCIRTSSFQLDSFAKSLPAFRRLQTLKLTLVPTGDMSISAAGSRIVRSNPRLHHLSLSFVHSGYPHALPRRSWLLFLIPRLVEANATFSIERDQFGLPETLGIHERRTTVWPWRGLVHQSKVSAQDLRPSTAANRNVVRILFERSAAGEEMRMIVFCSMLVCFAGVFALRD
ncbi:unnamed protein product [Mycena citricolor]|uniref:Uncharacterized protein n=1 Tax=Mycena citricolor TaxID=2018698 RepID=A0AAD2HT01_9AGAR|nr:unnamed protein product [Mycena citricolor]